jgi:SAM-dependent methyltransferase
MEKKVIKDIIQWDVQSWKKPFNFWESNIDWDKVNNCLELGANNGGLSLWLALKGKHVVCSDLTGIQAKAEPLHKKYGVEKLITYQDIDATNIPYENHFDIIVFKSIIGGISRENDEVQKQIFKQIHKALKKGGKLLFAENTKASKLHQKLRKKYVKWGASWRYVSVDEMHAALKDFSKYEMHSTGVMGTFGRSEGQRNFLSAIDKIALNAITPKSWKYICYGVAEK